MKHFIAGLLFLFTMAGAFAPAVWADVPVPPLRSAVTDLTGTLSSSEAQSLDARLQAFSRERGSQIAVL
ncbi:MAG TPA: YgcG family protein, partial [Burkholderiales bacterium]|nr:YgcG family protein [Burkholderiales bacterium]